MGCKRELLPREEATKVAASARAEKKRHHHYQNVQAQARHKLSRWEVEARPRLPHYRLRCGFGRRAEEGLWADAARADAQR